MAATVRAVVLAMLVLAACGDDEPVCPLVNVSGSTDVVRLQFKVFEPGASDMSLNATADLIAERSAMSALPASINVCAGERSRDGITLRVFGFGTESTLTAASVATNMNDFDTLSYDVTVSRDVVTASDIEDATTSVAYFQSTLSGYCIGGSRDAGAEVIQDECVAGTAYVFEQIQFVEDGTTYNQLRVAGTDLCLELPGATEELRAHTALGLCGDGLSHQLFRLIGPTTRAQMQAKHSGQCLNVDESSLSAGAVIQQYTCGTFDNQFFTRLWTL